MEKRGQGETMKHLLGLFLVFALYYKGVLVADDFEMIQTTKDKLGADVEVRIYDPHSTIDFEKYVDKSGFKYEFITKTSKEIYDDLTLFMCTKNKGHVDITFRKKLGQI